MAASPPSMGAEELPLASINPSEAAHTTNYAPLPAEDEQTVFLRPRPQFVSDGSNSPRGSSIRDSSAPELTPVSSKAFLSKTEEYSPPPSTQKSKRRLIVLIIALSILLALIAAIVIPVYFTVIKPKNNASKVTSTGSTDAPNPTSTSGTTPKVAVFGGDGSTVTASNGSTFTYSNKLGGIWYYDPDDPYNNNAYPNSWTPPLNRSWNFKTDRIYGVNLGGWFVLEPFITPALYQKYPAAIDEWTISTAMAADTAGGGISQLEEHYKTFITEDDIAEIAGAGLNWIRLPIPYWAIDVWNNEPFLARTSWKYIVQALGWCRKYGLRVKIDLHSVPGSQNGYNHSGMFGVTNFLRGTMGIANAQRLLHYIRVFTEFFSQPEWRDVVVIFGIVNEARMDLIGESQMWSFYYETYKMMRNITGTGEGRGPWISIHNAFVPLTRWPTGFMPGADRVIVDAHPYVAFDSPASTEPLDTGLGPGAGGIWPTRPCERWAATFNTTRATYGVTIAGEWTNAVNDCGLFVRGVNIVPTFGGDCAIHSDSTTWTPGMKAGVMRLAMANMDAYRDWFFWTWKVAPSQRGVVEAPLWSYQLGLRNGWMPLDPRTAIGTCGASAGPVWNEEFESWMTGGPGAGQLRTDYPWPPATLTNAPAPATALPIYTPTGSISTLPVPTYTDRAGKPIVSGNGWFNAQDTIPAPTPISGCAYPDPWNAENVTVPPGCVAGS